MRGLLFDKDGTLIDFNASWAPLYRTLTIQLCDGDEERASAMLVTGGMHPERGTFRSGSVLAAGNARDIAIFWFPSLAGPQLDAMVARIDRVFFDNAGFSVPLPGMAETIAALAEAGWAMGVATSDGTAGTRAALAALGLERMLPHVFGYDAVTHPKPAPDCVFAFAAATGLEPGEIAVIGDNPHDLEMARSAGAVAIGVLSGNSRREDFGTLADAVLDSVSDLPRWLAEQARG